MPRMPQANFYQPIAGGLDRIAQAEIARRQRQAEFETNQAQAQYLRGWNDKLHELRNSGNPNIDWAQEMRSFAESAMSEQANSISLADYQNAFQARMAMNLEQQVESLRAEQKNYAGQLIRSELQNQSTQILQDTGGDGLKAREAMVGVVYDPVTGGYAQTWLDQFNGDAQAAQIEAEKFEAGVFSSGDAMKVQEILKRGDLSSAKKMELITSIRFGIEENPDQLPGTVQQARLDTLGKGIEAAYDLLKKDDLSKLQDAYIKGLNQWDNWKLSGQASNLTMLDGLFGTFESSPFPEVKERAAELKRSLILEADKTRADEAEKQRSARNLLALMDRQRKGEIQRSLIQDETMNMLSRGELTVEDATTAFKTFDQWNTVVTMPEFAPIFERVKGNPGGEAYLLQAIRRASSKFTAGAAPQEIMRSLMTDMDNFTKGQITYALTGNNMRQGGMLGTVTQPVNNEELKFRQGRLFEFSQAISKDGNVQAVRRHLELKTSEGLETRQQWKLYEDEIGRELKSLLWVSVGGGQKAGPEIRPDGPSIQDNQPQYRISGKYIKPGYDNNGNRIWQVWDGQTWRPATNDAGLKNYLEGK